MNSTEAVQSFLAESSQPVIAATSNSVISSRDDIDVTNEGEDVAAGLFENGLDANRSE